MPHELHIQDLKKMAYEPCLEVQRELQRAVIAGREQSDPSPFHLILVEHDPPVITVSKRPTATNHLLATEEQLQLAGVQVCATDRGGGAGEPRPSGAVGGGHGAARPGGGPGGAGDSSVASRLRRFPVYDSYRLRRAGIERVVLHGDRVRLLAWW